MCDIRARLGGDGFLPQCSFATIAESSEGVAAAEERPIFQTRVDVDAPSGSVFLPARVIGIDMSCGGPSNSNAVPGSARSRQHARWPEPNRFQ